MTEKISVEHAVKIAQTAVANNNFEAANSVISALLKVGHLDYSLVLPLIQKNLWAGDEVSARSLLGNVLVLAPEHAYSWRAAYIFHVFHGEWGKALDAIEKCRRYGDNSTEVDLYEAELCLRLVQPKKAISLLDRNLSAKNALAAWKVKAPALAMLGRHEELVSDLPIFLASQELQGFEYASLWKELGTSYDKLGQYEDAFTAFFTGNEIEKKAYEIKDRGRLIDLMDAWRTVFTADWVGEWPAGDKSVVSPVFLIGFPRSGTTLVEQALDAHPELVALEEKDALEKTLLLAMKELEGGGVEKSGVSSLSWKDAAVRSLKKLSNIDEARVEAWRSYYWERISEHVELGSKTLVDKMPLNTIHIGFILRLFPAARFIVALRHPADCVLSAYMQSFKMNAAMANFLDLDDAASFYAGVMQLLQHYISVLPMSQNLHFVRYETVVSDFDKEIGALLSFLGLEMTPDVSNYAQHALHRGTLNTPSARSVTKALYRDATNRWRNYERHLEPVFHHLEPACVWFGYKVHGNS